MNVALREDYDPSRLLDAIEGPLLTHTSHLYVSIVPELVKKFHAHTLTLLATSVHLTTYSSVRILYSFVHIPCLLQYIDRSLSRLK